MKSANVIDYLIKDNELKRAAGGAGTTTGTMRRVKVFQTRCQQCGGWDFFGVPVEEPLTSHRCSQCGTMIPWQCFEFIEERDVKVRSF